MSNSNRPTRCQILTLAELDRVEIGEQTNLPLSLLYLLLLLANCLHAYPKLLFYDKHEILVCVFPGFRPCESIAFPDPNNADSN